MDAVQMVSLTIAAAAGIGAVLSYFKYKPGQRDQVATDVEQARVNVAQGTLNIAQGTINLVTSELEDQFKRMSAQVRDLEERLSEQNRATQSSREDLEKRIDTLSRDLRTAQGEKDEVERRNVILLDRVKHLEDEVATLKKGP